MRINEVTEERIPHLYLDMDGVQADFFGEWAKRHKVKHYKEMSNREEAIIELANSSPENVYDFFYSLKPLPGGQKIIQWIKHYKIPFTVLSAPLRGPFGSASIQAKKDWLDRYNPGTSGTAIFTSGKQKYATTDGSPNVLVDDFGKYINAWIEKGGIPVKHDDEHENPGTGEHTISMLEKIYAPYLNKM